MTKRDEYVEKLKKQIDQWNADVTRWEGKAQQIKSDMRAEYDQQLQALRQGRDDAQEKMRQVQSATEDAWMDLKQGADEALSKLKAAFDKARARFQK